MPPGDPNDGYMDMMGMMGMLPGLPPPGQGGAAPQGGQPAPEDVAQRSLIQRLFGGGTASMPGSPMLGQIPDDSMFGKMMPKHPRLGGALDSAALAASMVPQGQTTGENIAGVAGAISNLPYARLMHAYSMLNPQLQAQMGVSQLGGQQAGALETLARGQYYGGRNLAQVEAQRQRDAQEAQIHVEGSKPTVVNMVADKDYPEWGAKKGEHLVGNMTQQVTGHNPDGSPIISTHMEPFDSYKNYTGGGGVNTSGAVTEGADQRLPGGVAGLVLGAYTNRTAPGSAQIIAGYQQKAKDTAAATQGASGNTVGQKDTKSLWDEQNKSMATLAKQAATDKSLEDPTKYTFTQLDALREQYKAAGKPVSDDDAAFKAQVAKERAAQRSAISDAAARYQDMPVGANRPDPGAWMRQALQTPTSGATATPQRPPGVPPDANWNPTTRTWSK